MSENAYSGRRVRKSLLHFLSGKVASALVGFSILLLLVRALSREEYGAYVALVALFEILQLGSNFGVFAATFRYVPELRARNDVSRLRRLTRDLLLFRTLTLLACAAFLAVAAPHIARWIDMPWMSNALRLYALVLLFEGLARFTDQLFDSLLLQGYSQACILLRNGLRLLGLLLLGTHIVSGVAFNIQLWVAVEAVASGVGALLSIYLLNLSIRRPQEDSAQRANDIDYGRVRAYALPAYTSQVVGLAQGPDVVKLLVARLADAVQTGAFGFAAALNGMMQRYLPVFLLIGMVRPLFVSAKEQGRSNAELVGLASLVFKLNVFVLAPLGALVVVMGDPIANVLSGGKFPEAGLYLAALLVLLLFQTLRTVIGLLALVVEESRAGLTGTITGLAGFAGGVLAFPVFGPIALCGGLIASELLWCLAMQRALARHGVAFRTDVLGMGKIAISAGFVILLLLSVRSWLHVPQGIAILISLVAAGVSFLLIAYLIKPFLGSERGLINRVLPRSLFVW